MHALTCTQSAILVKNTSDREQFIAKNTCLGRCIPIDITKDEIKYLPDPEILLENREIDDVDLSCNVDVKRDSQVYEAKPLKRKSANARRSIKKPTHSRPQSEIKKEDREKIILEKIIYDKNLLNHEQENRLKQVVIDNSDAFSCNDSELGCSKTFKYEKKSLETPEI